MRRTSWWLFPLVFFSLLGSACAGSPFAKPPSGVATSLSATSGTLMAVGDLNFTDGLGAKILSDPAYPWLDVKDILKQATVLVGNLEAPLSNRGSVYTKKTWLLRADPRTVLALTAAGLKVVTLANNHMMDYGPLALQDTLATLNRSHIRHTGAGADLAAGRKAAFYTAPGRIRFAFLAYSQTFPQEFWATSDHPGTVFGKPEVFLEDIQKAKQNANYVVVSFHWSQELVDEPLLYQKNYARQCIDAGASLVLGHHPHVLQGFEVYHGGLIAYSLGNFAFGSFSRKVRDSVILAVDYDREGLIRARLFPVNVNNYEVAFQPQLYHGAAAERVLQDLRVSSAEFQTPLISEGETGVIRIRP